MAVALLWTGCEGRDDIDPKQGNPFILSVYLPVEETYAPAGGGPLRVMGDPGTTERFELPRYVYIIIMKKAAGDPDWSLWQALSLTPGEGDWTKKRYGGVLPTVGDSIYEYNHEIDLLLSSEKFDGRVYAIASAVELSFNRTLNLSGLTSLSDVETLTFNSGASGIQENLQHIYSTPYNYKPNGVDYYGSFDKAQKVPHVSLLLYHVAAKVDINWFVAENKRIDRETPANAVRLTSMKACNLFNGDAYCFKPMENKQATKLNPSAGTGDTITMVTPSDMGLWWEGRSYFYTIPYTLSSGANQSHYPLQMQMETNESGAIYKPTVYLEVNTSSPFVPWLRATFNINNPLAAGTAEKTVPLTP